MQETSLWLWVGFNAFILAMLALDLGVFHRKSHEVSLREATIWSAVWVALALAFNAGIFYFRGTEQGVQFICSRTAVFSPAELRSLSSCIRWCSAWHCFSEQK